FSMPPHPLLPIHLLYHARHLPFRDSELDRTQGNAPEGDTDIIGYRIRPIRSWRRRGSMDKSDRFAGFGLPRGFFYRQVFRRFSGLDRDEHPSIGSYVLTLFTHDGRRDNTRIPMNAGGYRSEGHRDRSMIPGTRIVGRLIGGRRVGSLDNMNVRRLDLLNGVSPGRAAFLTTFAEGSQVLHQQLPPCLVKITYLTLVLVAHPRHRQCGRGGDLTF